MERYKIYCTPEQTRKALELGAPIQLWSEYYKNQEHDFKLDTPMPCKQFTNGYCAASCPTAEQMIGWLEGKGLCIEPYRTACGYLCTISKVPSGTQIYSQKYEGDDKDSGQFTTRGKATLAAIDAALEYLTKKKSHEEN